MVELRGQDFRVKHSLTVMDDALSSLKTKPVLGPGTPIPGPFLLRDTLKGERSVYSRLSCFVGLSEADGRWARTLPQ